MADKHQYARIIPKHEDILVNAFTHTPYKGDLAPVVWVTPHPTEAEKLFTFRVLLASEKYVEGRDAPLGGESQSYISGQMHKAVNNYLADVFKMGSSAVKWGGGGQKFVEDYAVSNPAVISHLEALFAENKDVTLRYEDGQTPNPRKLNPAQYPDAPQTFQALEEGINSAAERAAKLALSKIESRKAKK